MYENGLVSRVTRTNAPSGERSMARNIAGWPTFVTPAAAARAFPVFAGGALMSMSTSCPVACHSSNWNSYGVDIRLGNVRSRFLSVSSLSLTEGPAGDVGAAGAGGRLSGTTMVAIALLSSVNSNVDTSVASTGERVICRGWLVAMSVSQMWVASSVWTK